jgi:RNA polymerase-binding protein DksA
MNDAKSPLSEEELADYRRRLLEKRRQLAGDLGGAVEELEEQTGKPTSSSPTDLPTHNADAASDEHDESVNLAAEEADRQIIQEIDEAIRRIDEGSYGLCMATGKPIERDRLEARPWARYCFEYAQQAERMR